MCIEHSNHLLREMGLELVVFQVFFCSILQYVCEAFDGIISGDSFHMIFDS